MRFLREKTLKDTVGTPQEEKITTSGHKRDKVNIMDKQDKSFFTVILNINHNILRVYAFLQYELQ